MRVYHRGGHEGTPHATGQSRGFAQRSVRFDEAMVKTVTATRSYNCRHQLSIAGRGRSVIGHGARLSVYVVCGRGTTWIQQSHNRAARRPETSLQASPGVRNTGLRLEIPSTAPPPRFERPRSALVLSHEPCLLPPLRSSSNLQPAKQNHCMSCRLPCAGALRVVQFLELMRSSAEHIERVGEASWHVIVQRATRCGVTPHLFARCTWISGEPQHEQVSSMY